MGTVHPLQNDLILDQVFLHLDLDDLKICRLVCSKWEHTSRKPFMKKSTICISNGQSDLKKFWKDFIVDSRDSIEWHFTKFNFVGELDTDDLDAFIASQANILEGIKFTNIYTTNAKRDRENWKWNWYLTHLKQFEFISNWMGMVCSNVDMTLALSNLRTTKTIILQDGRNLKIILDEKISPSSLTVGSKAKFRTKNGLRLLNEFSLNEFFEIKNLVHLDFGRVKKVIVDLSESHKLETCTFYGGQITGWNRHLKALTKLDLRCDYFDPMAVPTSVKDLSVRFNQPNETMNLSDFLELETLRIEYKAAEDWGRNLMFSGQIDLSLLPKSLERLDVKGRYSFDSLVFCSSPSTTSFPKIKRLPCCYRDEFPLYQFCPSLTELSMSGGQLLAHLLPEAVKLINIKGPMAICGSPPTGAVDMVTVKDFRLPLEWHLIDEIFRKLNPRSLIVDANFFKSTQQIISQKVLKRIRNSIDKQMERPDGIFVIRKLKWTDSDNLSAKKMKNILRKNGLPLGLMFESHIFEGGLGVPEKQWHI